MKKFKVFAAVLALAFSMAGAVSASAASQGITEEEQQLLDKFKAGIEVNGEIVTPPASYINQAENELMRTDVTSEEIAILNERMDEVYAIIQEEQLTTPAEVRQSGRLDEMVEIGQEAAAVVDYTLSFNASTRAVTVKNQAGEVIFETKNVVNQTGFDFTATFVTIGILGASLVAGIAVAGRKGLFAREAEV